MGPRIVEYAATMWEHIQSAKLEKSEILIVWLDLADVYGSVPHQLLCLAMERFHLTQ